MDQATVTLQPLNPIEKRRTYHYKSGASFSLENVEAIKIEDGYERVRTADGKLHIVYLVICRKGNSVDYVVSKEFDCEAWTF